MVTALGLFVVVFYNVVSAHGQLLQSNSVHRTPAAERPVNDLWCYRCQTMDPLDRCADLKANYTVFSSKCKDDKRVCMVKKFSYTMSNENSTSEQKMWSLERNCTKHCEPGCIVIGERTKLYACTSCCDTALCNNGNGRGATLFRNSNMASSFMAAILIAITNNKIHNGVETVFRLFSCFAISIVLIENTYWILNSL